MDNKRFDFLDWLRVILYILLLSEFVYGGIVVQFGELEVGICIWLVGMLLLIYWIA